MFIFSLYEIFPDLEPTTGLNGVVSAHSPGWQAGMQMAAIVLTLIIAILGGLVTGSGFTKNIDLPNWRIQHFIQGVHG